VTAPVPLSSSRTRLRLAAFLIASAAAASPAVAGPPYVTDDPEPTDLGHWEIYLFGSAGGARGAWDGAAGADLNYGAFDNVQLTATLPLDVTHARGGATRAGAGDVELGVKYRFLHKDAAGLDVSVFPRLILPTAGRRFGTGRIAVLLPVWAQKDLGAWSVFGGGGYTIDPGPGNRDFWQGGLALTRAVSKRLSLGGEATVEGPDSRGGRGEVGLGLGGILELGGPFSLLASAGPVRERRGAGGWRAYAALGISF
jgi:hypothetical protein